MLNKKYRLTKRKQFNYIYRKGRSSHSELLTLVFSYCKMKNIRVGFSASKKVGNSVKRHRALRQMRECVRPLLDQMTPNHNYIFVAKDKIVGAQFEDIKKCVQKVLEKSNLLVK